jgi:hypothetical protein
MLEFVFEYLYETRDLPVEIVVFLQLMKLGKDLDGCLVFSDFRGEPAKI